MLKDILIKIDSLRSRLIEAWGRLDLETRKHEIAALEAAMSASDFWNDQARARRESQQLAELKKEVEQWSALRVEILEVHELALFMEKDSSTSMEPELEQRSLELEQKFSALEFALLMNQPRDAANAVVAIHAGAGGTDAQDWSEMLMRMYFRYAEKQGWQVRLVDESRGTEAGIKSATFFVEGRYAYGHLKGEAGVHRLVRLSPFNADALRQTSFALVEVLPEFDEKIEVEIKPDDLRIDTFMSGGKGGQSVNTTYSAVRIVHLPTKLTVSCQNERSQTQNKETALKILKAKLLKLKEEELLQEKQQLRGEYHSAEWGNQIRSYVLQPYRLVKDHRTNFEMSDTEAVLNGDLDGFIEAELKLIHQASRANSTRED